MTVSTNRKRHACAKADVNELTASAGEPDGGLREGVRAVADAAAAVLEPLGVHGPLHETANQGVQAAVRARAVSVTVSPACGRSSCSAPFSICIEEEHILCTPTAPVQYEYHSYTLVRKSQTLDSKTLTVCILVLLVHLLWLLLSERTPNKSPPASPTQSQSQAVPPPPPLQYSTHIGSLIQYRVMCTYSLPGICTLPFVSVPNRSRKPTDIRHLCEAHTPFPSCSVFHSLFTWL